MRIGLVFAAALSLSLLPDVAEAWPGSTQYIPIYKGGAVLQDPAGDSVGARNIVGDAAFPSAYMYNDGTDLYMRLRVDSDPAGTGGQGLLKNFGWGVVFDTNMNADQYEWLFMLDGISSPEEIALRQNTVPGTIGDPSDNAEFLADTAPLAGNYQVSVADSSFNGDADYFVDWRFNHAAFRSWTGLSPDTPFRVLFGTSSSTQSLTESGADLAGGTGLTLSTGLSDAVTLQQLLGVTLSIAKTVDVATAFPGDNVTYAITLRNDGSADAQVLSISDTLPAAFTYVAGSSSGATSADPVASGASLVWSGTWTVPAAVSGVPGALTLSFSAQAAFPTGTHYNVAGASGTNFATLTTGDTAPVTVASPAAVSLSTATTAVSADPGAPVRFPVVISNNGTVTDSYALTYVQDVFAYVFYLDDGDGLFEPGGDDGSPVTSTGSVAAGNSVTVWAAAAVPSGTPGGTADTITVTATSVYDPMVSATSGNLSVNVLRTAALIAFTDNAWAKAAAYPAGSEVCVEVADVDRNLDGTTAETIAATLTDGSDTETVSLLESGPDTGVFRGCVPSTTASTAAGDGSLSAPPRTQITASCTDPLDAVPTVTTLAWMAPGGILFDSGTGLPVAGASVSLLDTLGTVVPVPAGWANPVTTGTDGGFSFPAVGAGDYRLLAAAGAAYSFPSLVPDGSLPGGFTVVTGSRGEIFHLAPPGVLVFDIPVDPPLGPEIRIEKSADHTRVSMGDLLRYTIVVKNVGGAGVTAIEVRDVFPRGFSYRSGTSRLNGASFADPGADGARTYLWTLGDLAPGGTLTLTYVAAVGAGAGVGSKTNVAVAQGVSGAGAVSARAAAAVEVEEGVFTERGIIIGKVFEDRDCDGFADEGEPGVPEVVLYLEDGTRTVTDPDGLFHVRRVTAATHVLALDTATLPKGMCATPTSNRFMGDPRSQFVDMTAGGLNKANFGLYPCGGEEAQISAPLPAEAAPAAPAEAEPAPASESGELEKTLLGITDEPPATVKVVPESASVPADGRTAVTVGVEIRDRTGRAPSGSGFVTVEATAGDLQGEDADPASAGHQVRAEGGRATVTLRAPRTPGEALIRARAGAAEGEAAVFFAPDLRDEMLVVGVGDLYVGPERGKDADGVDGRAAFFAKGRVFEKVLLTTAYDSDGGQDDFFAPAAEGENKEDDMPTYGDRSETGYEARSADKLYARLDRERSHLLYGDFQTALEQNVLTPYRRTFTGAEAVADEGPVNLYGFMTDTGRTQVVDALPGKGISGFYYLSRSPVTAGSDRVVLQTREWGHESHVLSVEPMMRGVDYRIDNRTGTLLFLRPVPGYDENLNPVYVVASYETEGGEEFGIYGGRLGISPLSWLEVGATSIVEEQAFEDYRLTGADVTVKLPGDTVLRAEAARTRAVFDEAAVFEAREDNAWLVEARSEPLRGLDLRAHWSDVGDDFKNPSATSVNRGERDYGFEGGYDLDEATRLSARYFHEKDTLNDFTHWRTSAGAERAFGGGVKASMELAHEEADDAYVPPADSTSRVPYDSSFATPDVLTSLRASLSAPLTRDFTARLSHRQSLAGSDGNLSSAGLDYALDEQSRLYFRTEYATYDDGDLWRSVFGGESKLSDSATAYTESRIDNGQDRSRNTEIFGLRNRLSLSEGVTADFSLEHQTTVAGKAAPGEPDAFAATAAVNYLPDKKTKMTGRAEYRVLTDDGSAHSVLGEAGVARRIGSDHSVALTGLFHDDRTQEAGRVGRYGVRLGVARRPLGNDRLHALTSLEYRRELDRRTAAESDTRALIGTVSGNYQVTRDTWLQAKWAGKSNRDYGESTYTDLGSLGVVHDLTDRVDLGLTYRILRTPGAEAVEQGGRAEAGYRLVKNLWLSAGYSFDSFDEDLTGDSYTSKGPYLRIRVKWLPGLTGGDSGESCRLPAVAVVAPPPVEPPPPPPPEPDPLGDLGAAPTAALIAPPPVDSEPTVDMAEVAVEVPKPAIAPSASVVMQTDPYVVSTATYIELVIHFDTGKALIKDRYLNQISAVAELLRSSPGIKVTIEGHTDNVGKDAANKTLSVRRARAVVEVLTGQFGIDVSRLNAVGYGPDYPIAPNDTAEGRALNRRVYAKISAD